MGLGRERVWGGRWLREGDGLGREMGLGRVREGAGLGER